MMIIIVILQKHCVYLFAQNVIADHVAMEEVLRRSGLDWTIVRPYNLTRASARGRYRLQGDVGRIKGAENSVSRADLARFLVQEIGSRKWLQREVAISD
jgi:uncharacterized protein YbjT (DUF2867 family)